MDEEKLQQINDVFALYKDGFESGALIENQPYKKPEGWIDRDPTIYPTAQAALEADKINPGSKFWTDTDGQVYCGVVFNTDLFKFPSGEGNYTESVTYNGTPKIWINNNG